jgi:hypothetical protein
MQSHPPLAMTILVLLSLATNLHAQEIPCKPGTFNKQYNFSCDAYINGDGNVFPNLLRTIEGEVRQSDAHLDKGHHMNRKSCA